MSRFVTSPVVLWMGLLGLTALGCKGTVVTQETTCEPGAGQPCGSGAGGGGSTGGGGAGGAPHMARRFGDESRQICRSVALDSAGNVLLVGDLDGAVDFGGGPLFSSGFRDMYAAKLDPGLNHLHSKVYGDGSSQSGFDIFEDKGGHLLLTGEFQGSIDFGGGPLQGNGDLDLFVTKLTSELGHLHGKRFGDPTQTAGRSIVADADGNPIVAGYFKGSVDLGGGLLQSGGGDDVFLAKFDPQLGHLHSKSFGGEANQLGYDVAVDSAGNIVLAGYFEGSIDLGGGPLVSAGDMDVFVARFDPQLGHLHSRSFGDPDLQIVWRVALDMADNVVLAGYFRGAPDFGGGPLVSAGDLDAYVVKFDPQLQHIASRRFGDAGSQIGVGLATDGSGNVVIAGYFEDSIDLGGGPLVSAGDVDAYVAKLDPQLQHVWSKRFGDDRQQEILGVAVDSQGDVVVAGEFWGSIDFGEGPLVSAGDADIFVARLPP